MISSMPISSASVPVYLFNFLFLSVFVKMSWGDEKNRSSRSVWERQYSEFDPDLGLVKWTLPCTDLFKGWATWWVLLLSPPTALLRAQSKAAHGDLLQGVCLNVIRSSLSPKEQGAFTYVMSLAVTSRKYVNNIMGFQPRFHIATKCMKSLKYAKW